MHILKEEFHTLFEKSNSLGDGILELTDWLKKAQPYYKKSVETIKRWLGEIGGYFEERTTNGVHLTFANTSSGKLTIKISTAKRKDRGNILDIPLCPR